MTVTENARTHAVRVVTRWLELIGQPVIWLAEADRVDGGWKRFARCGQWHPAAPDPEIFFPVEADMPSTYVAQTLCSQCPVRQYCGADAERHAWPGVWAGVYRDDHGRPAALCATPDCQRYRSKGHDECRECSARLSRERAVARQKARTARQKDARHAAKAAAQEEVVAA